MVSNFFWFLPELFFVFAQLLCCSVALCFKCFFQDECFLLTKAFVHDMLYMHYRGGPYEIVFHIICTQQAPISA